MCSFLKHLLSRALRSFLYIFSVLHASSVGYNTIFGDVFCFDQNMASGEPDSAGDSCGNADKLAYSMNDANKTEKDDCPLNTPWTFWLDK